MAAAGIGSRRTCETWITTGRVRVNGQLVTELGTRVDPANDKVTFDGHIVRQPTRRYYIALNKPRGVISSRSDAHASRLVTDLVDLASKPMLRPVGRLDAETEGLIFLSDDGDFLNKLTHPRHHVPKTYRAVVRGVPDAAVITKLRLGVHLEDGPTAPAENVRVRRVIQDRSAAPEEPPRPNSGDPENRRSPRNSESVKLSKTNPAPQNWGRGAPDSGAPKAWAEPTAEIELTIFEGRNRQVRRMLGSLGHPVLHLKRIQIGTVRLSGLPAGAWRHLTVKEIADLTREPEMDKKTQDEAKQENSQLWHAQSPSTRPRASLSHSSKKPTPRSRPQTS